MRARINQGVGRVFFRSPIVSLPGPFRAVVEALHRDGACVTSLAELELEFDEACAAEVEFLRSQIVFNQASGDKSFLGTVPQDMADRCPNLIRWGLEERLLGMVESYLGLPANYRGFLARRDIADTSDAGTRRWHMDGEDSRTVKLIVYLNDIDEKVGPFEFIPRRLTPSIPREIFVAGRVPDEVMERYVPRGEWVSCTGPVGTVVVADTCRIFHRGKPPSAGARDTLFFHFTSRNMLDLQVTRQCFDAAAFGAEAADLSPRQRAAIGLR